MITLRTIWLKLHSLWRRLVVKREIDEELRLHIEQRAATAKAFAAQGARVFVTYFRPACRFTEAELKKAVAAGIGGVLLYSAGQQQPIEPLLETVRAAGGLCAAREADLADPAQIGALFDACEAALGPADILVNNHTCCLKDTFDPGRVTEQGFGVHLVTAGSIDSARGLPVVCPAV